MANVLFLPELREMLAANDDAALREILTEHHPASVADFTEGLTPEETWALFDYAPLSNQAAIFSFYSPPKQDELVRTGEPRRVSQLLSVMPHDDRVELLRRLPKSTVEDILPLIDRADRVDIRQLLSYPEHSAGAIMTTDFATLPVDITVDEAIRRLRNQAATRETIYYNYITDAEKRLLGLVSLRDLILAQPNVRLEDIMTTEVVSVRVEDDQEQVARLMSRYDFLAVPVVDAENHLVGIVTHDDILDVLTEEATEDAQRQAAVVPTAEPYLEVSFVRAWRTRAIWLSCLFVAELFTFTALASFEHAIAQVVALSLFVPLCISTGGNSGSQAATLITRALALGEVTPAQWRRVLRHELLIGVALGLTLGVIGFVRASLTPASVLGNADRWTLASVIGLSVAGICLWGTIVGSMLPLVFRKLGFDPGYASSPFVATFVDVTGIVIYFTIAETLLL